MAREVMNDKFEYFHERDVSLDGIWIELIQSILVSAVSRKRR